MEAIQGRTPENCMTRKAWLYIAGTFVLSRAWIVLVGWLSIWVVPKGTWYDNPSSLLDLFFRWDSSWYLSIVREGYQYVPGKGCNVNFFPLYPMLVKLASWTGIDDRIAGLLISNACLAGAMALLYKLARLDYDDSTARRTVLYVLISPVSFFFSMFYAESLFLLLAVGAFYCARRNRWAAAGLLGCLLAGCRGVGVLVIIPLAVEYVHSRFKRQPADKGESASPGPIQSAPAWQGVSLDGLYLLLVPCGLLGYMLYLHFQFGEPLAFVHTQKLWGRPLTWFFDTLKGNRVQPPFYREFFYTAVAVASAIIAYMIRRRMRLSYVVLCLVFLLMYLSTCTLEAIPRYLSVLFPLFLGVGLFTRRPGRHWALAAVSLSLLTLCTILLTNGYWMT